MREVAEEEPGAAMMERVRVFREILAETPVDQAQVQGAHPMARSRVSINTRVEVIVRYPVDPKEAGRVRTRLLESDATEIERRTGSRAISQEQREMTFVERHCAEVKGNNHDIRKVLSA